MNEEEKNKVNIIVSIIFIFIAIIGCILAFIYIDKIKDFKLFDNDKTNDKVAVSEPREEKQIITSYKYLDIVKNDVTSSLEKNDGLYKKYIYFDVNYNDLLVFKKKDDNLKLLTTVNCNSSECELIKPNDIREGNHLFNVIVFVDGENYLLVNSNTNITYKVTNMNVNEFYNVDYVNRKVNNNIETKGIVFSKDNKIKYYSFSENNIVIESDATYNESDSSNYGNYIVIKYLKENTCISSLIDVNSGKEEKKLEGFYTSPLINERNKYGINTKLFYSDCDKKRVNILDDEYNPVYDEFYDNIEYDTNYFIAYNNDSDIYKEYNPFTKKITINSFSK